MLLSWWGMGMTLQPMRWCERLNLTGKITLQHEQDVERIIRDAIANVYHKGIAEGREQQKASSRAKTFEELAVHIGEEPGGDACLFARWLDEHGYKTFPDMPDYIL